MKTFREFIKEAEGFKKETDAKKRKKESYLSPREAKLKDLRKRPDSWKGLQ